MALVLYSSAIFALTMAVCAFLVFAAFHLVLLLLLLEVLVVFDFQVVSMGCLVGFGGLDPVFHRRVFHFHASMVSCVRSCRSFQALLASLVCLHNKLPRFGA